MSLSANSKLGPYQILGPIGAGGMGEVYRAKDSRLKRTVAIKVLQANLAENADRLRRFQQEAESAFALNHPNIVTIYEIGSAESMQFISMEFVEGKSLRELLAGGALSTRKLIQVVSQLAEGLSKAHEAGIVHRDLKPENVMISKDGVVKILDFGLAKLTIQDSESSSRDEIKTDPLTVLGTVGYMSPEQAMGGTVDFRSDQFSFGAILYEMATGKRAFHRATTAETLVAIIREEPESVNSMNTQMSVPLRWIMERCLAKDPDDRYASTRDLARDLQNIRDHISDVTSSATINLKGAPPHSQKKHLLRFTLPIALATFLLGGAVAWKLLHPSGERLMAIRALTYSGLDSAPAVAADGRLVAFSSKRDGQDRIWLRQMVSGNEVALTTGPNDNPRFSPDGSTVLFTRAESGHNSLYRIPTLGGEIRKIIENAESGDWSPDGKQIVFVRLEGQSDFQSSILYIANADGSLPRILSRVEKMTLQWPHWSPDGHWIVANAFPPGNFKLEKAILVIDAKNKEKKWLPVFSTGHTSAINWAGNSEQLLYEEQEMPIIGDRGLRPGNFLLQDIGSGKIRTLFWYPSMATSIQRVNGNQILFDASAARGNLREFTLTTEISAGSARWLTRGNSNDRQPQYSPDSEWIIFSSHRNGNLDLWQLSTKSGGVRRITEDTAQDWDPTFTPDGKHILWSSNRAGHFEIYFADVDGTGSRQLTSDGLDAENPSVTPDGRWVVYGSYNPNKSGVWKIRPDGAGATRIFTGVVQIPEVSPDGKYVCVGVFQRTLAETSVSLRVVRMEDGAQFQLNPVITNSLTAISGGRCRWMPDGKRVAYVDKNEEGAWGIYVQDFIPGQNTINSRKPIVGFDPDSPTESFGISPDGSRITICQREESSSLVLAENPPLR
jgi:serine/threonine protein kinase